MKILRITLICSVLLAILLVFNLFAATPTPTPIVGTPTPSRIVGTPTPTRGATQTPTPTPTRRVTPTPMRYYKYYKNIDGHNNIGTANDLEVYLEGNQTGRMKYWNRPDFPYWICYYDPVSNRTIVRFYGTTVQYCDYVMACLKSDIPIKEVARRTWTRDGVPIGSMDPVLSTSFQIVQRQLTITFGNYVQGGGTVTLRGFQYGFIYRVYDLEELTWEYLQDQITWIPVTSFQPELGEGATQDSPPITIPDNAVGIIYSAQSGLIDKPIIYIEQYIPFPLTPTPTPTRRVTPTPTRRVTPTPTFSYYKYYKNIDGHNNIGTANDLEVYLEGDHRGRLSYWNRPTFPYWTYYYDPVSNRTIVRFYGATVQYCQYVMACLKSDIPIKEVNRRTWTRDGVPIGSMDPVLSTSYLINQRQLTITFGNYVQGGGTVTLRGFQYGFIYRVYDLSELTWEYLQDQINWIPVAGFQPELGEGATQAYSPITIPDNAVGIVYYAQSGSSDKPVIYIEQYTPFPPTSTPTPTPTIRVTPTTPISGGYLVTYLISSDWGNGAFVDVTIKNNTSTAVNGWTLAWIFPGNQTITNLWNGTYTQSGQSVSVKDAGHNATIGANGGTVSFGFNITYSGTNAKPTSFTLNGTACQVQ